MKSVSKRLQSIFCMMLFAAVLFALTCAMNADAAGNYITVTSALSGEKFYSGDDLQAAFDDFPVYDVPQFPHVFGAAVLVVEIIGVFPHVDTVEGCHAVSHGGVAVVAADNG